MSAAPTDSQAPHPADAALQAQQLATALQREVHEAMRRTYLRGWQNGVSHGVLLGALLAAAAVLGALANGWVRGGV